jgi:hypothetical protein
VEIEEVDHVAVQQAVDDVAQRAARISDSAQQNMRWPRAFSAGRR